LRWMIYWGGELVVASEEELQGKASASRAARTFANKQFTFPVV